LTEQDTYPSPSESEPEQEDPLIFHPISVAYTFALLFADSAILAGGFKTSIKGEKVRSPTQKQKDAKRKRINNSMTEAP
jgi:hypothetical protein